MRFDTTLFKVFASLWLFMILGLFGVISMPNISGYLFGSDHVSKLHKQIEPAIQRSYYQK